MALDDFWRPLSRHGTPSDRNQDKNEDFPPLSKLVTIPEWRFPRVILPALALSQKRVHAGREYLASKQRNTPRGRA